MLRTWEDKLKKMFVSCSGIGSVLETTGGTGIESKAIGRSGADGSYPGVCDKAGVGAAKPLTIGVTNPLGCGESISKSHGVKVGEDRPECPVPAGVDGAGTGE